MPLTFQQAILKLHEYWAAQDCLIWEPYNVQLGAGTGNPATTLRVLGPEPWRVAYVEPSVRPDDGRFGENPNRMQKYYQYQVILKPDPGNPQELYLGSLSALGINPREHDIRFVEDNWESPALGAWGLGWEVWLDGQEITQFTYFQQAGGQSLDPVSVEITYGIERIVLALQGVDSAWDIDWLEGVNYGDVMFSDEVEHCRYYFDVADVDALRTVFQVYEREYARALEGDALISAYDYVLKCSHLFNVLDTRGAIGVTERANYFRRMREMTREIAAEYIAQRAQLGHPLMKMSQRWAGAAVQVLPAMPAPPSQAADFLLEIGVEEMPAADVESAARQARIAAVTLFDELRLNHAGIEVHATPRRLIIRVSQLKARQPDKEAVAKGPPADRAYDADGQPTRAALGFARGKGVAVDALRIENISGRYVTALVRTAGKPATEVLAEALPGFIAGLRFPKSMRWNESGVAFSRPIRWLVALLGDSVIPCAYAGIASGRSTRGLRPYGSPLFELTDPQAYQRFCAEQGIVLDAQERKAVIAAQVSALAKEVAGDVAADEDLLTEVANLVEAPTAFRGEFAPDFLDLPRDVLVTVMRKHQRYFAVQGAAGGLLPYFIGVRNGDSQRLDTVIQGNEQVIRARFSDARFFFAADTAKPLTDFLPRLDTLTFQAKLGSMRQKNDRVAAMVPALGALLGLDARSIDIAGRAAAIVKADLATSMVVEMTSLQGVMGREYALREGVNPLVATAIFEHWLPRAAGDTLPATEAGRLLALADKLDSLVGLFAVGLAPKSTSDPYGLRRSALGIIQILVERSLAVDLRELIALAAARQPVSVSDQAQAQVFDFARRRLDNWLDDEFNHPRDVINAVLAEQAQNPAGALAGIEALSQWVAREDWELILDSFARCVRITRKEAPQQFDPALLADAREQALWAAVSAAAEVELRPGDVSGFLAAFETMVPAVTDFFDNVLVHAEEAALRRNRIALLQIISRMQAGAADLSLLADF
ncbi:MAG: glycine--tRNA ligase subunit beta [Chloroflexi bacterium]|nr:glycine--tRNA ligase subunit beta [Chloroflexota bacterium]MCY3581682.1 glycine--tRNA ligase subunit beta [Chloroflexota bacterium]MCY3715003.1 glycine--tRNA ligase subunit beta [Chloroflexota bacterium]MDE2651825.1 glycine--tRNA ligase subunit beta [Chloroflexota bacterium]MXX82674.1 glycine--tRNA ligase subunit beta [Chloroflexota bacterium]